VTAPTIDDTWALVTRAQAGDTDAFAALYRKHHPNVFRFIRSRTGSLHTAEDLASDVWVRALNGIGRIEYQGRDFGAWLTTIARNITADYFKSKRVQLVTPVEDMHTWDLAAGDDPEREAVTSVARAEAGRLLSEVIAKLTPGQRQVIELRFYEGLNTVESAAAMGVEVGAAKTLQSRATASLRRQLAEVTSC
jgi:RNA polymerase sigma-70 factor, ECF subfamily